MSASVLVVQGNRGLAVRPVVFVVPASVPLVLIASAAKGECMVVVPGWVAGVAKVYVALLPAAAGTRPHALSTPKWMWLMGQFLKWVVG